jgi:general bacterial porin, GBP family
MKKHLIAAAVAAAVAVPAAAQVTVSGALEAGYGQTKTDNVSNNTVSGNVLVTPFIRFSGSEDLGGGLKASFNLVNEFNTATGAETGSVNAPTAFATGSPTADVFEETSIAVTGGFGGIKLGRFNFTARDNGGVYRFAGEFGRIGGGFRSLGSQPTNSIEYTSPTISGVSVAIARSNAGSKTASATSLNQTGVSVGYSAGPLAARYSKITADNGTATRDNEEEFFGVTYNLGFARVGLLLADEQATTAASDQEVTVLTALVPLGNGIDLHASMHDYKTGTANQTADAYTLGLTKALSKRTTAYIAYASVKNTGGAYALATLASTGTANRTNTGTAIGVRHTF